ncbi:hypothetical protein C8J56DRAFT_1065108 [Mycena floridula]|nr:hypothetical protein C8J56DRAFT_1065108 [Mycena floridula]
MQFKFSAFLLATVLATTSVIASPVVEATAMTERSVRDDCFNEGFEDGEAAGCNAASNGRRRELPVELQRRLSCTGTNGDAFNQGFNEGFNDGFNKCF